LLFLINIFIEVYRIPVLSQKSLHCKFISNRSTDYQENDKSEF
jgi:hypothetical protein